MSRPRTERRHGNRIRLNAPLVARVGSYGAIVLDVSEGGARIEHYTRMNTGQIATLRFESDGRVVNTECRVMSCRVARFASGEDGLTVYQSGLMFTHPLDDGTAAVMRAIGSGLVTRTLAEQLANAKGVTPVDERSMPIFRGEVMTSNEFSAIASEKNKHLIPIKELVTNRGYLCCRLERGRRWVKKWSADPTQPREGFTVSVHEPAEQVDMLCASYLEADGTGRRLIRLMAAMSIEGKEGEKSSITP